MTETTAKDTNKDLAALVNDENFKDFLIPSFIFLLIMMVLCIPGNSVVIVVYYRRWRKTTYGVFVIALAVYDLMVGIFTMPAEMAITRYSFNYEVSVTCKISRTMTAALLCASAWVLLAIALDRFLRFKSGTKISNRLARQIVLYSSIASFLVYIPGYFVFGIQKTLHVYSTDNGSVVVHGGACWIEESYRNSGTVPILAGIVLSHNVLVIIAIIYIYTFVLSMIKAYLPKKDREFLADNVEASKKRTKMIRTSLMLCLVTLIYILSSLPFLIVIVIDQVSLDFPGNLSSTGKAVQNLLLRSFALSISSNPIIYFSLSRSFRDECKKLLKVSSKCSC